MTRRRREWYVRVRNGAGRLLRRPRPVPPAPEAEPAAVPRRGHPPDVALEPTHLGAAMDEAVLRAKRRMRVGADPDYDLVYEHFDVLHYLLQSPRLLDRPRLDLVDHFLSTRAGHARSPDPDFSMTGYLERYPEKADSRELSPYLDWLKRGRAGGEIADPAPSLPQMAPVLGLDPQEVVDLVVERRSDLRNRLRTGRLGEMFAKAAEIEPLIAQAWTETTRPRMIPFTRRVVTDQIAALHRAQEEAGFRRARLVIVVDQVRRDGDRRMEGHLAHALAVHVDPDAIVVLSTDRSAEGEAGSFPAGVREIDFARIVGTLKPEDARTALVVLLRSFQADAVVNVSSLMLRQSLQTYGRALAASERVFPCFFGKTRTAMGTWEGWGLRDFYRAFDYVAGVITDSGHLARELVERHRVGDDDRRRLHVLHAPVDPDLPVVSPPPRAHGRRPQVFWAGDPSRHEGGGLLLQVAQLMPDVDFRVWAEPPTPASAGQVPSNVSVRDRCDHLADFPLDEADVWLSTSGSSDRVPTRLCDVAVTGVPIVGPRSGPDDVLGEDDSWPVAEEEGADAFVRAIRAAVADPTESRRRALALRERMLRERGQDTFARQAAEVLLTRDTGEESR